MKTESLCLAALLALGACDALAAPAALSTRAHVAYTQFAPVPDNGAVTNTGEASTSATLSAPGLSGSADAQASFGLLQVSGRAISTNAEASILAVGESVWRDVLDFRIFPEQPTSGSAPGFIASVTVSGSGTLYGAVDVPGFHTIDIRGPGTYAFSGLITGPVSIQIALGGEALATRQQSASFAGAVRWNGIDRIVLPKSSENPRFSVTSASGFDYALAAPVPEPSTLLMGMAALAALCARTARRR